MDFARETPLDACPDLVCRRSGLCRSTAANQPCRKFFMTADEWRNDLAETLERLYVEWGGDPAHIGMELPEPSPEAWAELYNAMREREAEYDAEERSANVLARRR